MDSKMSEMLEKLKKSGVALRSLQESWVSTDDGPGEVMIAIMAWVAKQERLRLIERTKAGLERAKAGGKKLGRPLGTKDKRRRLRNGYNLRWSKESKR